MVKLKISEPHIVAMGPDSRTAGWGSYQFPSILQTREGYLVCSFSNAPDSTASYNIPHRRCVSKDGGVTWEETAYDAYNDQNGVLLPNGERIRFAGLSCIPENEVKLPKPLGTEFRDGSTCYRVSDFDDPRIKLTWKLYRYAPDGTETLEETTLHWKNAFIRTRSGVLVPPGPQGRLRIDKNGVLWQPHCTGGGVDPESGGFVPYHCMYLFSSEDLGHTWELREFTPYTPDIRKHPLAFYLEGWNENDVGFAPDGTMIRLCRLDGRWPPRNTPMHVTYSSDGNHWTELEPFDDHGVWPCLLNLDCGVTLASYGRPGVQIRATDDPSGRKWDDPIDIIHVDVVPETDRMNMVPRATCGYTNMIALDDHTAALVHTDFRILDKNGIPRKTVLYRTVTVE